MKMTKTASLAAFTPSTSGGTTFESTAFHVPSTTFGVAALPTRIFDLVYDLFTSEPPVTWAPAVPADEHELELSADALRLLNAGAEDVQRGRVRRLDPNEFDDE